MKKILVLSIICLLLCSCSLTKPVSQNVTIDLGKGNSSIVKLSMVGDALIHSSIYKDALDEGKYDFSKMFEEFAPLIEKSDLIYYNQESIIGGDSLGFFGYPHYNTPSNFAKTLIGMGFNLVSRANEHALDQGEKGLLNSCNFWNRYSSVLTNGSACTEDERITPKYLEKNGMKFAFLSYTTVANEDYKPKDHYLNIYSDEVVKEDIDKVREEVDVVLVAMHWGEEFESEPSEEQKRIAKYLSELGVDVVIGTHPHVIGPIEWIDNTLVAYSLGNFISGHDKEDDYNKRIGLVLHLDFVKTAYNEKNVLEKKNPRGELVFIYSESGKNYKVLPFSKLEDSILPDYRNKKIKYEAIVKKYTSNVSID